MAFLFLTFRKMGPKPRSPHTIPLDRMAAEDITFDTNTAEFPPKPEPEEDMVFDPDTTAFLPVNIEVPVTRPMSTVEANTSMQPQEDTGDTWPVGAMPTLDEDLPPPETVRTNPSLPLELQAAVLRERLLQAGAPQIQANDTSELKQCIGETAVEHVRTPVTPPEIERWLALPHHLHGQPTGQTIGEFLARSDHETTHYPNEALTLAKDTVFYIHRGRVHVNTRATQDALPIAILHEGQFFGEIAAVGGQATAFLTAQPNEENAFPIILKVELSPNDLPRHIIELNALNAIHEARAK